MLAIKGCNENKIESLKKTFSPILCRSSKKISPSPFLPPNATKSERMLEDRETKQQTKYHCTEVAIHSKKNKTKKTLVRPIVSHFDEADFFRRLNTQEHGNESNIKQR